MFRLIKYSLLLLGIGYCNQAKGQLTIADSTQRRLDSTEAVPGAKAKYINQVDFFQNRDFFEGDTVLNYLHQDENSQGTFVPWAGLSNHATGAFPLVPRVIRPVGFDFGLYNFDIYRYIPENILLINTQNPFTELYFAQAGGSIQRFDGTHSQNIKPNFNVTLMGRGYNAGGLYTNSRQLQSGFALTSWYSSLSNRYKASLAVTANQINSREFGGVTNPEDPEAVGRRATVFLEDAGHKVKEGNYLFNHVLYFGPPGVFRLKGKDKDTALGIRPKAFIGHTIKYVNSWNLFQAKGVPRGYFPERIYDTLNTNDRLLYEEVKNRVTFGNTPGPIGLRGNIFGEYSYIVTRDKVNVYKGDNTSLGAEGSVGLGLVSFQSDLWYCLQGRNEGDYKFGLQGTTLFSSRSKFNPLVQLVVQRYSPAWIARSLYLNHFSWSLQDSLVPTEAQELHVGNSIYLGKTGYLTITAGANRTKNYTNFGIKGRPIQVDTNLSTAWLEAKGEDRIGRVSLSGLARASVTSDNDLLPVTPFFGRFSGYYEQPFKSRGFVVRLGSDIRYTAKYKSYRYIPDIRQLGLSDSGFSGGSPIFDIWVGLKLHRFYTFFKMENILAPKFTSDWPGYPTFGRAIHFGLRWQFYN